MVVDGTISKPRRHLMNGYIDLSSTPPVEGGTSLAGSSATAGGNSSRLRRTLVVAMGAAMLGLSLVGGASADGWQLQKTSFAAPVCYSEEIGTYFCHPSSSTGVFFLKNTNSP
jgi:hypothetical protein